MKSTDLILHHYDASPFTQKTLRMLGIKGIDWFSVETPMVPPKSDLILLTGGYRGTPVLQIGADIYIDNQRIAVELERRFPEPSLFPFGNTGINQMLVKWSDAFFRTGLFMAIALQSKDWPEEFLSDRKALFSDLDFDVITKDINHTRSQFRAHSSLINTQLSDGRKFLEGDKPSLADIHAFSVPWFTRAAMPEVNDLLSRFKFLLAWEQRVAEIGEGTRNIINAKKAHDIARDTVPDIEINIDSADATGLSPGQIVSVSPVDSQRGIVKGEIVVATADEIAVQHLDPVIGTIIVHYPRIGYRVTVN